MIIIEKSQDCGNAPKNKLVENVAIALYTNDLGYLNAFLNEDSIWEFHMSKADGGSIPEMNHRNAMAVQDGMQTNDRRHFQKMRIISAISHGKIGAVELEWHLDETNFFRESLFIEFRTAKASQISSIRSYG